MVQDRVPPRACKGGGGGGGGFATPCLAIGGGGGSGGGGESVTLPSTRRPASASGASMIRMASLRESISDTSRSVLIVANSAKTLSSPTTTGTIEQESRLYRVQLHRPGAGLSNCLRTLIKGCLQEAAEQQGLLMSFWGGSSQAEQLERMLNQLLGGSVLRVCHKATVTM